MKYAVLIPLVALGTALTSYAQPIFRCEGNLYTTDPVEAKGKGCKAFSGGGNVTVIQGTRVQGASGPGAALTPVKVAAANPSSAGTRVDSAEQKARDADARQILESELKKAETRQAELLKEFNNGEPDKQGAEARNYQKYLDRVAELKANIARNDNDIAGLKRELVRVPASK